MGNEHVTTQLDTIIALLKLTNRDKLESVRRGLDDVAKALLEASTEPVTVGALKKIVASTTKQSEKTVQRRIADLTAMGVLTKTGGGSTARYHSTGIL